MVDSGSVRVACRLRTGGCDPVSASPAAWRGHARPNPTREDRWWATTCSRPRVTRRTSGASARPLARTVAAQAVRPWPPTAGAGGDVSADVLRRLRERVDRNVRLVDRMRADPLAPEPPGLPELIDTARRMRHDAETLLLLAGIDPGPRPGAPARLSALLDEAVDATDEPMRVDVRSGPNATVEPGAAIELLHVVSEVVDHVTAIHPGARVEVSSRTEAPGGIVVEIRTASTTRYDPAGRRGMAAATRIAQRSRSGLVLRTPLPGPAGARGADRHHPLPGPRGDRPRAGLLAMARRDLLRRAGATGASAGRTAGAPPRSRPRRRARDTRPRPPPRSARRPAVAAHHGRGAVQRAVGRDERRAASRHGDDQLGGQAAVRPAPTGSARTGGAAPRNGRAHPARRARSTSCSARWSTCPLEQQPEATPIFEAVASAWFRDDVRARPPTATGSRRATGSGGPPPSARPSSRRRHVHRRGSAAQAAGRAAGAAAALRRPADGDGAHARPPPRPRTGCPTGSASAWPPTSAGCARADIAPSRSTPAIPPPGDVLRCPSLLLVVVNRRSSHRADGS